MCASSNSEIYNNQIQPQGPCSGTLASNLLTAFGLLAFAQVKVILSEADREAE
jgi:hypothetical protein